ncbi:MAG: immunoglobulin domain-containing protein [Sedimentisphaerales bacterium]|nr:immunoglobulin domain-containing protein [Sedimentisphaerales bacterium]MBN2842294.1 immunoglobulin domain-containing protein [Sedimentisphaerales bacterium]
MKRFFTVLMLLFVTATVNAYPGLLEWYKFDQSPIDSAGSNNATVIGNAMSYVKGPVSFDQYYAANPDGSNYYELPLTAYPNAGDGNGMSSFTYSLWINFSHSSDKQRIMGNFNANDSTALRLTAVGGNPGKVDFWIRSASNVSTTVTTGTGTVPLNTWTHIAVTYNGASLCMYANGVLMQEVAYSATDFNVWENPTTIMAENLRGVVGGFYNGMIDDFRLYDAPMTAAEVASLYRYQDVRATAHDPVPSNGQDYVGLDQVLSWTSALDPNDMTRTNPDVKAHYVWMSGADDANMVLVDTIAVTNYSDPSAGCMYDPADGAIELDGVYKWSIEEGLDNGSGGVYPAGDENNIDSPVWTFTAIPSSPDIIVQPVSVLTGVGEEATFTVNYVSPRDVTVVWYKDETALTVGGNVSVTTTSDSSTLTISDVSVASEGQYYCVITGGESTTSDSAVLVTEKLLAQYKFEQDLVDEIGGVNGSAVTSLTYAERVAGDYAVETDGLNYIEMATTAYPNGGFGNGMDHFTYSFFVKPSTLITSDARIMGVFNDGNNTGLQVGITSAGAVRCFLRQDGGASLTVDTPAGTAPLGSWSFVTITYDGSKLTYYINGSMLQENSVSTLTNFSAWQYAVTYLSKNSRSEIVEPFIGMIDDLRIYNYAVNEMEVAGLYYQLTGENVCVESLRPSADYDLNDDCIVNILDIAIFSSKWLESGIYTGQE